MCQRAKLDVFASQSSITDQFCPRSARRPLISEISYEGITEDASLFRRSCLSAVLIWKSFCFCHSCFSCCSNPSGSCSRATGHSRGYPLGYGFRNDVSKLPLHLSSTATLQEHSVKVGKTGSHTPTPAGFALGKLMSSKGGRWLRREVHSSVERNGINIGFTTSLLLVRTYGPLPE